MFDICFLWKMTSQYETFEPELCILPLFLSLTCLASRCRSACGSWWFATFRLCRFLPLHSWSCHCDWGRPLTPHPLRTSPASHCKNGRENREREGRKDGRTQKETDNKTGQRRHMSLLRSTTLGRVQGLIPCPGSHTEPAEQHARKKKLGYKLHHAFEFY